MANEGGGESGFGLIEERHELHRLRQIAHHPGPHLLVRIRQRHDVVRHLLVRMRGLHRRLNRRQPPLRDDDFRPPLGRPVLLAQGAAEGIRPGKRSETALAFRPKRALVVIAHVARARCEHGSFDRIGVVLGRVERQRIELIAHRLQDLQGRRVDADALGQVLADARVDVIEVRVDGEDGNVVLERRHDSALNGTAARQALEAFEDDRVVNDDRLGAHFDRFANQRLGAVERDDGLGNFGVRKAHEVPRIVVGRLKRPRGPLIEGVQDFANRGRLCILHGIKIKPQKLSPRLLLLPFAALHGAVLAVRHKLYDWGVLRSAPGALPTVALGNLTVGGTGKTPHAVWLVGELEALVGAGRVAILSRGYGRKTRGFREVAATDRAADAGDEPVMMKRQLPEVVVAVCEDRLTGLDQIHSRHPHISWVVLDDALQHRRLRPTVRLLIVDATAPLRGDHLLPAGRLRDLKSRAKAADAVIVSRDSDPPHDRQALGIPAGLPTFSTSMRLAAPPAEGPVFAIAGIARPDRFFNDLAPIYEITGTRAFPDHHPFTAADARWIGSKCARDNARLVTTEKDWVRLSEHASLLPDNPPLLPRLEVEPRDVGRFRVWFAERIQSHRPATRRK